MTATISLIPLAGSLKLSFDLDGIDPTDTSYDIEHLGDNLFPTRITITYKQQPNLVTPRSITVDIKGWFRDPNGRISALSDTTEVWNDMIHHPRPQWIADAVTANTPDWWTE